jgi:chorismate-pyruvate lyase
LNDPACDAVSRDVASSREASSNSLALETLGRLLSDFPDASRLDGPEFVTVDPGSVPEPYSTLLVHENHMTVTLEEFHGVPVDLEVLDVHRNARVYSRKLLLHAGPGGPVVMAGIVRLRLDLCGARAEAEIVAASRPLGRILIDAGILRRIELHSVLRVRRSSRFPALWTRAPLATATFGRVATIHCDEQPAVELLEIVAPENRREVLS